MRSTLRATLLGVALLVVLTVPAAPAAAQDYDCGDFANQAQAQQFFVSQGGPAADPHGLDGDADGIACESLPCPCSTAAAPPPPPPDLPAPPEDRTVERVTAGRVVAELSYIELADYPYVRDAHVRIVRDGVTYRDERLRKTCRFCTVVPVHTFGAGRKSIALRDLDGNDEPELLLNLFNGGANCCYYATIYGYVGPGYRRTAYTWGLGVRIRNLDDRGRLEFVGTDSRFRYRFGCGACGPLPIRIWQYRGSRVRDVTRRFPNRVAQDARRMLRTYRRTRNNGLGTAGVALAAYAADMCSIRHCRQAFRLIDAARRRRDLSRARGGIAPFDRAYVRALKRLLRRTGHMR